MERAFEEKKTLVYNIVHSLKLVASSFFFSPIDAHIDDEKKIVGQEKKRLCNGCTRVHLDNIDWQFVRSSTPGGHIHLRVRRACVRRVIVSVVVGQWS